MAKILVVENDNGIREFLGDFFASSSEHTVTMVENTQTVTDMIEAGLFLFDLAIVANHGIPDMKGVELIEQIKNPFPRLPIILISGLPEPFWHQADAFLSKPFYVDKLGEMATRLLETGV